MTRSEMNASFRMELDDSEAKAIRDFCAAADYFAIEQAIGFPEILYKTRITYFWLSDDRGIMSFAQINETTGCAHIWFGPVCDDPMVMIESVRRIADFYRRKGYWYLGIQPYRKSGPEADYIEYSLNRELRIKYLYNNENTKSSLEIALHRNLNDISNHFSKGHKSAVTKAGKSGITLQELNTPADIQDFVGIYEKMRNHRRIKGHTAEEIIGICNYILENRCGNILLAKDPDDVVIGGSVFVVQGISVRYLLSATDPSRRDLPVTHYIINKAIERFKDLGYRYFDFWGYNHFARPGEQIYNVNKFKKGFGGNYIFLMKKMNISLIPGGFALFRFYTFLRKAKSGNLRFFKRSGSGEHE
jgi:hypothetical protein